MHQPVLINNRKILLLYTMDIYYWLVGKLSEYFSKMYEFFKYFSDNESAIPQDMTTIFKQ